MPSPRPAAVHQSLRFCLVASVALIALVAAGCAGDAGDAGDAESSGSVDAGPTAAPTSTSDPDPTPDASDAPDPDGTGGATDRPVATPAPSTGDPAAEQTSAAPQRADGEFAGTLGGSDIEGGCVWLDAEDGTRYELLTPTSADVVVDPSRLALITPEGDVIAQVGDAVVVEGVIDEGIMTFCQVGVNLAITSARLA